MKEPVVIESKKYMKHLVEQANLHFIVTGKVKETGQIVTAMKVVTLHNPKLSVKVCNRPYIRFLFVYFLASACALFMLFTSVVTSGVWREQSERRDDGDRGVHQPLLLRPGRSLHPHGRSWGHVAQIQILQVSCISFIVIHSDNFRT